MFSAFCHHLKNSQAVNNISSLMIESEKWDVVDFNWKLILNCILDELLIVILEKSYLIDCLGFNVLLSNTNEILWCVLGWWEAVYVYTVVKTLVHMHRIPTQAGSWLQCCQHHLKLVYIRGRLKSFICMILTNLQC